jgi:RNA polymerase sigma factor (sigma-70 family)
VSAVASPPRREARRRLPPGVEHRLVLDAKAGDHTARDELIAEFTPAIAGVARTYRNARAVSRVELMQEGVVGLLRAVRRYDVALDTPFWAYACWWVRQAMQQLISEMTRPVVLSDRALRQLARLRDARRVHRQEHKREPTCGELAAATGIARDTVDDLIVAERSARGLEEPVRADHDGGATLAEQLTDPCAEEAYDRVPQRLLVQELPALLRGLDERERSILCERFGLGCPERTLREVGVHLGVSAERVRQLEERALDKLRTAVDAGSERPICT